MRETILILGGTREAAELAARLVIERPDARIVTSLAGRTKEPSPVEGEVRTGGFGGIEAWEALISFPPDDEPWVVDDPNDAVFCIDDRCLG